jgi:hypothetical protein
VLVGTGYAGHGEGLNNPADEFAKNVGPLPVGKYTIAYALTDAVTGPVSMHLVPDPRNVMHGRGSFLIHGDNAAMNHTASDGCIIMARPIRETIDASRDRELQVVADYDPSSITTVV